VIRLLSAAEADASVGKLAEVLLDCIAGGASVGRPVPTSVFFKQLL
jgi:hypothetical protein